MPTVQEMDQQMARRVVEDAIAAGFTITVHDGEASPLKNSSDVEAILAAMFSTDSDQLFFLKDGKRVGWVFLVYGEYGWDVINDYTINLEDVLKGAMQLSETLEQAHV